MPALPPKFDTIRLLIIEDNVAVRRALEAMARELGFVDIRATTSAMEALEMIEATTPSFDLILCDWNMPGKNGLELLQALRLLHPALPFVMITARSDPDSVMAAKHEGVTAYVRKPFTASELKEKIKQALTASATTKRSA